MSTRCVRKAPDWCHKSYISNPNRQQGVLPSRVGQTVNRDIYQEILRCLFSAREKVGVWAKEMTTAPWQRIWSQCPEHPSLPDREQHCHAGTTSALTQPGFASFFSLIPKMMGLIKGTSFEHRDDVKMALPTELETVKGGGLRQRENRDICPLDLKYTFCDTSPGVCLTHLILYYNISIRIIMCVILLFTLEFLSPRQLFFLSGIFNFIKLTSCNKTILQLILILIGLCTIEFYHNMFYAPPLI